MAESTGWSIEIIIMKYRQRKQFMHLLIAGALITAIYNPGCSSATHGRHNSGNEASDQDMALGDLGWKMGMQAWSLRTMTVFDMADTIHRMGLHYVEGNSDQPIGGGLDGKVAIGMDDTLRRKMEDHLRKNGIQMISFGVIVPKTEEEWRRLFAFAEKSGIRQIVSDPDPSFLPLVSELCNQYDINVCIHNNPLPSRRSRNPDTVLADIRRANNPHIGACADIGNWVRAGFDPVKSLRKLEGHIMELHMKDLLGTAVDAEDAVWGEGNCMIGNVLAELRRQRFRGYIFVEFESHPGQNIPAIRQSLQFFYKTVATFHN